MPTPNSSPPPPASSPPSRTDIPVCPPSRYVSCRMVGLSRKGEIYVFPLSLENRGFRVLLRRSSARQGHRMGRRLESCRRKESSRDETRRQTNHLRNRRPQERRRHRLCRLRGQLRPQKSCRRDQSRKAAPQTHHIGRNQI